MTSTSTPGIDNFVHKKATGDHSGPTEQSTPRDSATRVRDDIFTQPCQHYNHYRRSAHSFDSITTLFNDIPIPSSKRFDSTQHPALSPAVS